MTPLTTIPSNESLEERCDSQCSTCACRTEANKSVKTGNAADKIVRSLGPAVKTLHESHAG